jgi:hypothetical protein
MPPAFNLSQDQTLQFDLDISLLQSAYADHNVFPLKELKRTKAEPGHRLAPTTDSYFVFHFSERLKGPKTFGRLIQTCA